MSTSSFSSSIISAIGPRRLEGKVALITGGASGIGAATAKLFVQQGANVVIADIQDDLGLSLAANIGSEFKGAILFVHCDVTNESHVQNAVDITIAKHGKLDIMFSNAGVAGKQISSILEADYDILKGVFEVNVFGSFFCAKHAARVMIPAKRGSIIFNASAASVVFGDVAHPYASSKTATVGLAKNLGVELGQHGIRVNCISPYMVATPLVLDAFEIDREDANKFFMEASNLKGSLLDEASTANAVLFLASDESNCVSGLNLVIDGGYSTMNNALGEARKIYFP